MFDDCTSTLVV